MATLNGFARWPKTLIGVVRNVSLAAVQELVASLPNLKLLDCSYCDQLGEQGVCQLRAQVILQVQKD